MEGEKKFYKEEEWEIKKKEHKQAREMDKLIEEMKKRQEEENKSRVLYERRKRKAAEFRKIKKRSK